MAQAAALSNCPIGDYNPLLNPNTNAVDNADNGYCVLLAQCEQDPVQRMINKVKNFTNDAQAVLAFGGSLSEEIEAAAGVLKNVAGMLVGSLVNKLMDKLKELMEQGINSLLKATNGLGISEILGLEGAVSQLSKQAICLINKIINGLQKTAVDLLSGIVGSVENMVTCAAEQFVGGFINNIIDSIADGFKPLLEPLEKIIPVGFKILDFLLGAVDAISAVKELLSCGEQKECPTVNGFFVGGDICNEEKPSFSSILGKASIAKGASNLADDFERQFGKWDIFGDGTSLAGNKSALGGCYTGPPLSCGSPTISIFGGGGAGAAGKVILGNVIDNTEGLSDVISKVGSVVGVEVTNPGSGYKTTPFVSISDDCNHGYGGYAKANVDFDTNSPTYGQIKSITIISSGVGYPIDEEIPLGVADAVIENSGSNYDPDDTLDGFDLTIENGRILSATLNSVIPTDGDVTLRVNTSTGSGAIIRPIINSLPVVEKKLQSVIDCIE